MDIAVHPMNNSGQIVCRIAVTEHTYITLCTVTYYPNINAHIINNFNPFPCKGFPIDE